MDKARSESNVDALSGDAWKSQDFTNTRLNLSVNSLALLMCRPEYKIAEAKVSSLIARVENVWGNTKVDGTLGALTLDDLTPHGSTLYPQRFSTMGRQVRTCAPTSSCAFLCMMIRGLVYVRVYVTMIIT